MAAVRILDSDNFVTTWWCSAAFLVYTPREYVAGEKRRCGTALEQRGFGFTTESLHCQCCKRWSTRSTQVLYEYCAFVFAGTVTFLHIILSFCCGGFTRVGFDVGAALMHKMENAQEELSLTCVASIACLPSGLFTAGFDPLRCPVCEAYARPFEALRQQGWDR